MRNHAAANGFSLLEALIAAGLLAGAIVILADLVTRASRQSAVAAGATLALSLAQSKLDQLHGEAFAFGDGGARVDSPALAPSAADALTRNSPPHVEALDRFGAIVFSEMEATFLRRWSIAPWADPPDLVTLAVCVTRVASDEASPTCVWGIRSRQP